MLNNTLITISRLLIRNDIPYMVIGGYAVLYHGEPRFTEDIDIVLGVDNDRLPELIKVTKDEFTLRVDNPEEFVQKTNVLPLKEKKSHVKVDLIFSFIEFERKAIQQADIAHVEGNKIRIVKAEDLIIYKLLAGRPKDIEDVKSVLQLNLNKINLDEITTKAHELSEMLGNKKILKKWKEIKQQ